VLKTANDRFYRSDVQHKQVSVNKLYRSRKRMFRFTDAKDVLGKAPMLGRLSGVKVCRKATGIS
jgi:hypothetical protein